MSEDSFSASRAGGSGAARDARDREPCLRYELLIKSLEKREPTETEFMELAEHEASCPSGLHSEEGVERRLGLPPGSLRNGSAEHGLHPPQELVEELLREHLPRPSLVLLS